MTMCPLLYISMLYDIFLSFSIDSFFFLPFSYFLGNATLVYFKLNVSFVKSHHEALLCKTQTNPINVPVHFLSQELSNKLGQCHVVWGVLFHFDISWYAESNCKKFNNSLSVQLDGSYYLCHAWSK